MTREELNGAVNACINETGAALQMVYDELNNGQRNKLLRNGDIKALFDRYGVKYEE